MFDTRDDSLQWLNTAASFAFGALLTWLVAEAVQRMRASPGPISDDIVLERVRARVARIVGDADAVQVTVENGTVRLAGEVPAEQRDQLLTQLAYMPGVLRLRNALALSP
jgi:osmotically-inducible protein OsmY